MKKITTCLFFYFSFLLLMILSSHAEPLLMPIQEVVAKSKDIVIADYQGKSGNGKDRLRVVRTLKGSWTPGLREVGRWAQGSISLNQGERVIAFVDDKAQFQWVARAQKNQSLETGILKIEGFYDFNAYLVPPSLLTLNLLEDYLKAGAMMYQFAGPLYFYSSEGVPIPSSIKISGRRAITSDPMKIGEQEIAGLPEVKGLPAPQVSIGGWGESQVTISYKNSWPHPLQISGKPLSYDGTTKTFATAFWISLPDLPEEKDFQNYIQDPAISHSYFAFPIHLDNGPTWVMTVGRELGGPTTLEGVSSQKLSFRNFEIKDNEIIGTLYSGEKFSLTLEKSSMPSEPFTEKIDNTPWLIRQSLSPTKCDVHFEGAGRSISQKCVLEKVLTKFEPALKK